MGRMLSYADLDAISAEGGRDTPFKIQMQIAEVTFSSTHTQSFSTLTWSWEFELF